MAANGYQKHILVGNLGSDPKVNTTKNGHLVTNFDIAVNERNTDGTEVVTWYGIAAWYGLGEVCAEYLKKGRQVMVEGTRMQATAWFGRDNNLYTKMELTANEVRFLGGNGDSNDAGNGGNHDNGRSHANNTEQQNNRRTLDGHKRQTRQTRHRLGRPKETRQTNQHRQQQTHEYDNALGYIPDNPEDIAF